MSNVQQKSVLNMTQKEFVKFEIEQLRASAQLVRGYALKLISQAERMEQRIAYIEKYINEKG